MKSITHYAVAVALLGGTVISSGCSTTKPKKNDTDAETQEQKITIKVPKGTAIEGQPCDNPDWTKLPPPVNAPSKDNSGKDGAEPTPADPTKNQ